LLHTDNLLPTIISSSPLIILCIRRSHENNEWKDEAGVALIADLEIRSIDRASQLEPMHERLDTGYLRGLDLVDQLDQSALF
jgi:hypothetical protein